MDAAIAALLGTLVGTLGTLGTTWLQQRHLTRRELTKVATELAAADYERLLARVKADGGGYMPPISMYVSYHADILQAIADGTFGPETVRSIEAKQAELMKAQPIRGGAKGASSVAAK